MSSQPVFESIFCQVKVFQLATLLCFRQLLHGLVCWSNLMKKLHLVVLLQSPYIMGIFSLLGKCMQTKRLGVLFNHMGTLGWSPRAVRGCVPPFPSARIVSSRVSTKQSPHFNSYYQHHLLKLTLDTGAETSMIKASVASNSNAIKKTSQQALQTWCHPTCCLWWDWSHSVAS